MLDLDPNLLGKCRCWQWAVVEYSWYSKSKKYLPCGQMSTGYIPSRPMNRSDESHEQAGCKDLILSDAFRFTMIYNSCRYYYYYFFYFFYFFYYYYYYYHCYYYSSTCHSDCNNNNNNNNKTASTKTNRTPCLIHEYQKKRYIYITGFSWVLIAIGITRKSRLKIGMKNLQGSMHSTWCFTAMKPCFPFRVLGGSPASAKTSPQKVGLRIFLSKTSQKKPLGWWLMVR